MIRAPVFWFVCVCINLLCAFILSISRKTSLAFSLRIWKGVSPLKVSQSWSSVSKKTSFRLRSSCSSGFFRSFLC